MDLPSSIGQLVALQQLHIGRCDMLGALPGNLGQVAALQELVLRDCSKVEALLGSIGEHAVIHCLTVGHSRRALLALPDSVGQVAALRCLKMCRADLAALPASITQRVARGELQLEVELDTE
jgi:hypothetical protein